MDIVLVPIASRGADTVTSLNDSSAAALKAVGFNFVVRYLGGLSAAELQDILGAGLGVQLVTYSRAPGWIPSAEIGSQDGAQDVAHLAALGGPAFGGPGDVALTVWVDLEGSGGDASATTEWVNARAQVLHEAGYVVGLYVGSGCVLNGAQLYALPNVSRYWRAFNAGIPVPQCGWCQQQLFPPDQTVAGVEIDYDVSMVDYENRVPSMLVG